MEVKVRGKRIEEINIEVEPMELLRGLQRYFGIDALYDTKSDSYWQWSEDGNSLVEMEDIARHGIPNYKETGRRISDNTKLKAYMLLDNVKKLMEEKENGKRNV